jgi:peptidoglycan hydrolase-like protein with peptidoglycan-binding domain
MGIKSIPINPAEAPTPDIEFAEDDVPGRSRPVPMPQPDLGPPTGIGRRIVLPSTAIPLPNPFRFTGSVGPGGDNFREDVIRAQLLLGNSGDYDLASLGAPTGWPGGELWRGIRKYQKRKGLTADGILLPVGADGVDEDGAGETIYALRDDLGSAFADRRAPTPEEVDRHYEEGERRRSHGEEDAAPLSEIAIRGENGVLPQYPLGTVSDADDPSPPEWRDGAQVAQALLLRPISAPPVGLAGGQPQSPYPHEQPEVKAAARQLEQLFDNAGVNLTNLLDAAQAAWTEGKSRDPRLSDAEQAALNMMPVDGAAKAASKTPPLVPPKVDDQLEGRPAEEQQAYIEKLIPPEMKEWHEGLEPFDQELARQLLIVMNRRGDETTQRGNAIFVKNYLEVFAQEFGHVRGKIKHVGGARDDKDDNVKEELLKDADTESVKGGSWADISFQFASHIAEAMNETGESDQRNRINTQTMQKSRPVPVADERRTEVNLRRNAEGQPVAGFPKLRPDLPGGKSSEAAQVQYGKDVADFARQNITEWIDYLQKGGFL